MINFGIFSERDYRLWSITMTTDCMAIQMQIELEVSQTGKAHQVDAFVWGLL